MNNHCQIQRFFQRAHTQQRAFLLGVFLLVPGVVIAQSPTSDCQCRAPDGQMRDLGSVECVDIVGNKALMICVMSTNTPYWKKIEHSDGCPA